MTLSLRQAARGTDDALVWKIIRPTVESGAYFCAEPEGGIEGGLAYFWPATARVWIAEEDGQPLGCFYLRPNQPGNGGHVCNAGYCTTEAARGRGVARFMLAASLQEARDHGYAAMQYNFVVSTNTRAIETWERAGFAVVGRLPRAFRHPSQGFVDALVMFKEL